MFGSEMLEVAIGLIFVFLLVSIVCAAIREGIESLRKTRAAHLEYAIRELLHDREGMGLARSLYAHPLIYCLYAGEYPGALTEGRPTALTRGGSLPSYIPSKNFALALIDIAVRGEDTDEVSGDPEAPRITTAAVRANLRELRNPPVQRMLLAAMDAADDDIYKLRLVLQEWYDSAMDRVSGMYKRSTQALILGIGMVLAVVLNVNALGIADYLYRNESARTAIAVAAEAAAGDAAFLEQTAVAAQSSLAALDLPIGWSNAALGVPEVAEPAAWAAFLLGSLFGWFITAISASLGAPFWFDVLNKVMVIRSTVKPREKSPEEGSEDRQPRGPRRVVVEGAGVAGPEVVSGAGAPDGANGPLIAAGAAGAELAPRGDPATQPGAAGAAPSVASIPIPAIYPAARDPESRLDGCDLQVDEPTPDERLPPARGGVGP